MFLTNAQSVLLGFDGHLIVKALDNELFDKSGVKVICRSSERFIQMTISARDMYYKSLFNPNYDHRAKTEEPVESSDEEGEEKKDGNMCFRWKERVKIRLIDSNEFMHAPLSKLALALEKEDSQYFTILRQAFHVLVGDMNWNVTDEDMKYMLKKLPFPYRYLKSEEVLQPGHPIPGREWFNNDLTGEECTDAEWKMVQEVCQRFKLNDFKTYVRVYCILDSLLLACVFCNYRGNSIKHYELDPAGCPTIASYSWQCFLYRTKARIEYISDPTMLKMIFSAVRGGQTFSTTKLVTANNEECPGGYDSAKPRQHILYLDLNSMYSFVMTKKFPAAEYQWLTADEIDRIDWGDDSIGADDRGYIVECDLIYTHDVMEKTTWLPLAPSKRRILYSELGKSQQERVNQLGSTGKSFLSQPKMILDCSDKYNYVCHYQVLRFYIQMGMKVVKVHRAIKFLEKDYFRPYVELNLELRRKAKAKTEKDMIKLTSNSIFGVSLMSTEHRLEAIFVGNREEALQLIVSPRFRNVVILNPNLSIVFLAPKKIVHDQIIQAGMIILDEAKHLFFKSYYTELVPAFSQGAMTLRLIYSDTDSATMVINDKENNFYEALYNARSILDFSKVSENSTLMKRYPELIGLNEGVGGLWKIETYSILSACFVRPKMYSLQMFDQTVEMRAKGLTKRSIRDVVHEDYVKVVTENKMIRIPMRCIRSVEHSVYNIEIDKLGFHSLDVSRCYYDPNDYNASLPYFHHRLFDCRCLDDKDDDSSN